jgi:hypothetical protein
VSSSSYYTLIPALPALPARMDQLKELPISILQLEKRLGMLEAADQRQLALALRLFQRERDGDEELSDRDEVQHWQQELAQIQDHTLKQLLEQHLIWRTLIAAQRYRLAGQSEGNGFQGFGDLVWLIRRHWQESDFSLGGRFPWLVEAQSMLKKGQSAELEQQLLVWFWQQLRELEQCNPFSFTAVAAYRLRWSIAEYRLRWQGEQAQEQFSRLVTSALAGFKQDETLHSVTEAG